MATRRPSPIPFVALAALLAALLPLGYVAFLWRPAPEPPPAPEPAAAPVLPPAPAPPELRIAELAGAVEVRGAEGDFAPAEVGRPVAEASAIRTMNGRAKLVATDAYEVQLEPGTLFEIGALKPDDARFTLGLGMVVARTLPSGKTRLEIAGAGSDATAWTRSGAFAMTNNGQGTVAVGAREGEVELAAAGKAVLLRAGQQSFVRRGGAPEAPVAIPSGVFLKVDWPRTREINTRQVTLTGRSTAGSLLVVGGKAVQVGADGRFRAVVDLKEGTNLLQAEALGLGAQRARSSAEVWVDTKAPRLDVSTEGLWEAPKAPAPP